METSTSDKWKHFERLVAAIHQAADQGAEVRWNEIIRGRQFDVTIRFQKGLYKYLTVIECKDYEKPISVEKVEAFVTKSADAQAHHAVMASTSGFQQGAQEVARRHNMTLIHVTQSSEIDLSVFGAHWAGVTDALHIQSIELEYTNGEKKRLPEEGNVMTYYVKHVVVQYRSERRTLDDLIQLHSQGFRGVQSDSYSDYVISFLSGSCVIAPDDGEIPLKPLARVHVRAGLTKARTIRAPVVFDPYLLVPDVKVRNVATGEENTFSQHDLAIGVDTAFIEGKFYEQPPLATYYYCDRIEGDIASLYLLESFQCGILVQAQFTQKTKCAKFYVPVSDPVVIERLQRRLERLKASQGKHGSKS